MKKTYLPLKLPSKKQNKSRPSTSTLPTDERLKVLANLIIDKLVEKYIVNSSNRS